MSRRVYPVPELVFGTGRAIDVKSGDGSMDVKSGVMRVPLIDTPAARHIRAHEMAHAKYSPAVPTAPKTLPDVAIQRAEDMRMNVYCRRQGLHEAMDAPTLDDPAILDKLITEPLVNGDKLGPITAAVSAYNTGDYEPVMDLIRRHDSDLAKTLSDFVPELWDKFDSSDTPSWKQTLDTATAAWKLAGEPEPEGGTGAPGDEDGSDSKAVSMSGGDMDQLVDAKMEREAEAQAEADKDPIESSVEVMEDMMKGFLRSGDNGITRDMKIVERPLRQRMAPSKRKARATTPADHGRVPRYMSRYCSDRAVFAGRGKRRDHGGAVLIDCSGSMRLFSEDIDAIMEAAPAGTVATYNGIDTRGQLWIIARNGKRAVDALKPPHIGNVVDVPALEWLAKQKTTERFWLCDGIVTGEYDSSYADVTERCAELCRQHRILRVPTMDALIAAMKRPFPKS